MEDRTNEPLPQLGAREAESHKGDFGRLMILAGSRGMVGAAGLAGLAALRSGAGLVTVASPASVQATVAAYCPSYTTVPLMEDEYGIVDLANIIELAGARQQYDAWAIGPGLGRGEGVTELVGQLYRDVPRPLVVDADGLNALASLLEGHADFLNKPAGPRILTPHPGEFARLTSSSNSHLSHEERIEQAGELARRDDDGNTIVILKGHRTIVTDGRQYAVNATGNPGMATGGTGDCLTGIVTALLAGGLAPFAAARLAAHVHGLAGDLAAETLGETSLISRDLIEYLPAAFCANLSRAK